jgi:hypothetical protein
MKPSPLLFCLLIVFLSMHSLTAQIDSLYTQQWNRDPVTSLNHTASAQRQIITAEQIRASGYTRLSDLVQLFDAWTYKTDAGERWTLLSNGTGNYDNQNWIVMVNGQRFYLPEKEALNNLGISITDIERIEIVNNSGMYLGEFSSNGLIHIVTKKITNNGFMYRGFLSDGLSTLTPGRQQYAASPYQTGLNTQHTIGYKHNQFQIQGTVNHQEFSNYDSIVYERSFFNYVPAVTTTQSYRIESQYTYKKLTQQLQFTHTNIDARLSVFSPLNGYKNASFAYAGVLNFNAKHQLKLTAQQSETYFSNNDGIPTSRNLNLQYRFLQPTKKGNIILQTGLAYLKQEYEFSFFKPFTSISLPVTRKTNMWAETQVSFSNRNAHPKFSFGLYKRVSFISNYSFVVSHSTVEQYEAYYFPIVPFVPTTTDHRYLSYFSNQTTADFYYNLNFGNSVKFSYNSGLKLSDNLFSQDYETYYYPPSLPFTQPLTTTDSRQLNWMNRFNFHYDIVKNLVFDINYMRTTILETSNNNLQQIPKHKFTLTVQYEFPKRFTLWTRNYWQSETKWWNEPAIYNWRYTGDFYRTLPAIYTWDAGISKKLYKDYLNVNISARNLFNNNERYFPMGAQFDTRFTASISANIDGLFASRPSKP